MKKSNSKTGNSKKRIAVFGNGFNGENLGLFMEGLMDNIPEKYADFFVFMSHGSYGQNEKIKKAENSIFELPDLKTFDAAIIYGPGLNFAESIEFICNKCAESCIPTIAIGIKDDRFTCVSIDNYKGMTDLVEHLMVDHGVKEVVYVGGSEENEDSNIRLQAVRDALARRGLSIKPENLHYSNWSILDANLYIEDMVKNRKPEEYPDAIIVANDYLAVFIIIQLERFGIKVPRDIIVSGFDASAESQVFYPSLATVDQNQKGIGKVVAQSLMERIDGDVKKVTNIVVECKATAGESCGCDNCRNEAEARCIVGRSRPEKRIMDSFRSARIKKIESTILKSDRFSNFSKIMQEAFYGDIGEEGPIFYILLDPRMSELGIVSPSDMPAFQYADRMSVIIGRDNDGFESYETEVDNAELLPEYFEYKDKRSNTLYVILPVYQDEFVCGYSVFGNQKYFFERDYYFTINERLIYTLESYRKNLELSSLYDKLAELMQDDPLTHVRNRVAYEKYKTSLEAGLAENKDKDFAIIMFDINNLKQVNDNWGHEIGDDYIKNCCKLICKVYKHSPVFRIGGDEFVAVLRGDDYDDRDRLIDEFRGAMDKLANADCDYERLSIASGMAVAVGDAPESLNETIRIADERMYMNKAMMKKKLF